MANQAPLLQSIDGFCRWLRSLLMLSITGPFSESCW